MVTWNRPTDNADVNRVILRERETKYSVQFHIFLCADRALIVIWESSSGILDPPWITHKVHHGTSRLFRGLWYRSRPSLSYHDWL